MDVNELYRTDQPAHIDPRLEAAAPRPGDDKVLAAELLTVRPAPARSGGAAMSFDVERLYELLPAFYRIRDTERGEPLKACWRSLPNRWPCWRRI